MRRYVHPRTPSSVACYNVSIILREAGTTVIPLHGLYGQYSEVYCGLHNTLRTYKMEGIQDTTDENMHTDYMLLNVRVVAITFKIIRARNSTIIVLLFCLLIRPIVLTGLVVVKPRIKTKE